MRPFAMPEVRGRITSFHSPDAHKLVDKLLPRNVGNDAFIGPIVDVVDEIAEDEEWFAERRDTAQRFDGPVNVGDDQHRRSSAPVPEGALAAVGEAKFSESINSA